MSDVSHLRAVPPRLLMGRDSGTVSLVADAESRGRVLVVDDEPTIRRLTKRMLCLQSVDAIEADCMASALAVAGEARDSIDFALVDMMLPDGSGATLVDRLTEALPNLRIVLFTGLPPAESIRTRPNVVATLLKPFSFDQLSTLVDTLIPPVEPHSAET